MFNYIRLVLATQHDCAITRIRVVLRTDNVSAQARVHVLGMLAPPTHGLNFTPKYIILRTLAACDSSFSRSL